MIEALSGEMKERKTAVAFGLFDGLHKGHTQVIRRVFGREGLSTAVFTISGHSLLPKLGDADRQYLMTDEKKWAMLDNMGIEYIYAPDFDSIKDMSPDEFVRDVVVGRLNAAYVVCGYDFTFAKEASGTAQLFAVLCRKRGITCEIVPEIRIDGDRVSSTEIRSLVRGGYIAAANRLLGYRFSYTLPVLRGKQIGRSIGYPTINQVIPYYLVEPAYGVYLSFAEIDGVKYKGITNIGVKPTVSEKGEENMETHILGYSGDLYDREITVELECFIRGERKFEDLDALKEQLRTDELFARSY